MPEVYKLSFAEAESFRSPYFKIRHVSSSGQEFNYFSSTLRDQTSEFPGAVGLIVGLIKDLVINDGVEHVPNVEFTFVDTNDLSKSLAVFSQGELVYIDFGYTASFLSNVGPYRIVETKLKLNGLRPTEILVIAEIGTGLTNRHIKRVFTDGTVGSVIRDVCALAHFEFKENKNDKVVAEILKASVTPEQGFVQSTTGMAFLRNLCNAYGLVLLIAKNGVDVHVHSAVGFTGMPTIELNWKEMNSFVGGMGFQYKARKKGTGKAVEGTILDTIKGYVEKGLEAVGLTQKGVTDKPVPLIKLGAADVIQPKVDTATPVAGPKVVEKTPNVVTPDVKPNQPPKVKPDGKAIVKKGDKATPGHGRPPVEDHQLQLAHDAAVKKLDDALEKLPNLRGSPDMSDGSLTDRLKGFAKTAKGLFSVFTDAMGFTNGRGHQSRDYDSLDLTLKIGHVMFVPGALVIIAGSIVQIDGNYRVVGLKHTFSHSSGFQTALRMARLYGLPQGAQKAIDDEKKAENAKRNVVTNPDGSVTETTTNIVLGFGDTEQTRITVGKDGSVVRVVTSGGKTIFNETNLPLDWDK